MRATVHLTLLLVSAAGLVIFLLVLFLTVFQADRVERAASEFLEHQVEQEVRGQLEALRNRAPGSALPGMLELMRKNLDRQKDHLLTLLQSDLPQKIRQVIQHRRNASTTTQLEQQVRQALEAKLAALSQGLTTVEELILGMYQRVLQRLITDIQIFSVSNAVLYFLILLMLTVGGRRRGLILPIGLLFLATLLAGVFYVFGQNWLYTILFNQYFGWSYLLFVGLIFGFLCDIVLNESRITRSLLEGLAKESPSALAEILLAL
jgi:hypothetical protein